MTNNILRSIAITVMAFISMITGDFIVGCIQETDYWPMWPMFNLTKFDYGYSLPLYFLLMVGFVYVALWLTRSKRQLVIGDKGKALK